MCRRIEEEVEPTVGLPRHRHFVGFFNVPVQTPTRDPPFYGFSEKPPHFSRLLRHARGCGGHILDLNPPGPHGGSLLLNILNYLLTQTQSICQRDRRPQNVVACPCKTVSFGKERNRSLVNFTRIEPFK